MNIYIFHRVENATDNYHSEGGVAIIAKDEQRARDIVKDDDYLIITDEEWEQAKVFELAKEYPEQLFIFPDAGCC